MGSRGQGLEQKSGSKAGFLLTDHTGCPFMKVHEACQGLLAVLPEREIYLQNRHDE